MHTDLHSVFIQPLRHIALPLTAALMLSGCSLTAILKSADTHYTLTPLESDSETTAYAQKILDERIAARIKTLTDDASDRAAQEEYMEQTLRADLLKALYAKGYYAAEIIYEDGARPLSGTYNITYGPAFSIGKVQVLPETYLPHLNMADLLPGTRLDAATVLNAQGQLYDSLRKDHCYFSLKAGNQTYLDRPHAQGDIDFIIEAGREGHFKGLTFQGHESVRESYLRKLAPWKDGDCFHREKLEDYKTRLLGSGLFARAEAILPDEPGPGGEVSVTMDLRERAHRSIKAGATYYSDEGIGVILGWEHRNLLGEAEKLTADLTLSALRQSVDAEFNKPYFLRQDQNLSLTSSLRRQDTDAYDELGFDAGIGLSRTFSKRLSGRTGLDFSVTRISDKAGDTEDTFGLISAPQTLAYDSRDDKLDPRKGWNITALAAPFFDVLGESDPFFKAQATASTYFTLDAEGSFILATKLGIGSLTGADLDNIPATERFYAGGGGSVRGFGYQEVGPKKAGGDPTGGRSIAHFSLELRSRFTDKIGGVIFVDGASVTEDSYPGFSPMAIGAGVGARYYTDFGPLRFDIAAPLTEKDDLDQPFQFYISIGQAF